MRRLMTPIFAAALVCAGTFAVSAQDKSTASKQSKEVQENTKTKTPNGSSTMSKDTIYGQVESYEQGKSLKVTVPGKTASTKSFDLNSKNWTYRVPSNIKPGQWVMVSEKTDNAGHKTLTVEHSSKERAARARRGTY